MRLNGEFEHAAAYDQKKVDARRLSKLATLGQARAYQFLCTKSASPETGPQPPMRRIDRSVGGQGKGAGPVILSLEVRQTVVGDRAVVDVQLTTFDEVTVETLWLRSGDTWLELGFFEDQAPIKEISGVRTYTKRIALMQLAEQLQNYPIFAKRGNAQTPTGRLHCYVQMSSTQSDIPKGAVEAQPLEEGANRYRYPMGKAWITQTEGFSPVKQPAAELTPYINKSGFLSITVGDMPEPRIKVHNDGLSVNAGCLRIDGRVFSRYASLSAARLILLGRTTGYRRAVAVEWGYRESYSKRLRGQWAYSFSAQYDFSQDLAAISDDVVDLYLEMDSACSPEPLRRRLGKTNRHTRELTKPGVAKNDTTALSIIPYYTYQAKRPSLQMEVFSRGAYDYLAAQLAKPRRRAKRNSNPVWLIGEMPYKAQDNGLHFFRYIRNKHPEIDAYYVIDPQSPEKSNLDGCDHVIDFRSDKHTDITLIADALIGTHSVNHFLPTLDKHFRKRIKAKTVFLQHGVTAQKWMAPVYAKTNKSGFYADQIIATSQREKDFIVHDFGFDADQVSITGFARFDSLFSEDATAKQKQLFIMPTWRPWLQDSDSFQESDYYLHWMGLLIGDELKNLTAKYNLQLVFCLHPNMRQYSHLFGHSGARVVTQGEVDVQHLIKESAVLLTDLSSVAMDFAFLHKPVVYYQFDANRFPRPHADPMTELPGPVVNNAEAVIQCLDEAFANNGRMTQEYQHRADRFIAHRDTNNCDRIFEAVKQPVCKTPLHRRWLESESVQRAYKRWRKHASYHPVMRRAYRLMRWLPMDNNTIVFESNLARSFGDNPLAIYNELVRCGDGRTKVIVCNKPVRHYDENTRIVKRHSPAFMYYMARSKYWVSSQNLPHYLRRRKNGIYAQTWHGTPLKKMAHDVHEIHGRDLGYFSRIDQASSQWGCLAVANWHTANALETAYGYNGPVLVTGAPRNDILVDKYSNQKRKYLRQQLSVKGNRFAVLYAPTFRDDKPTKRGRFAFDWPFEPGQWVNRLGDDVVLLVRTHNLISNKLSIPPELRHNIVDVSDYPDIQELFLASDMLVTDYSSSFFDYAILQRPIVFYAFDLDNYRDKLRGFYLDYDTELPGPVVTDAEALFAKIREYANPSSRPEQPIDPAFLKRFAPHEDGRASARVIEHLLGGVQ